MLAVLACCYTPAMAQRKSKQKAAPAAPYLNSALSTEARVQDLLARMTLEEKIGQMTQISTTEINNVTNPKTKSERFQPYLDEAKARKFIKEHHVGSFLAAFAVPAADWYTFSYNLQKVNLETSRLKIPIIYGNDHVHGANYLEGATIFPQPVNLAATWDTTFAAQMGKVTALEISDLGQHWNFAPILDIGRNPYWPRQYETFGEDPLITSHMGAAYIRALQNEPGAAPYKIAATAKHFIGYSDPKNGRDRASAVISDQELREIFLPPFRAAVNAGVKTFMINSGEVNGVPGHVNKELLQGLLRKELGFKGVIISDWADILQLIGQHRVAATEKEATLMALMAGIDMNMTATTTTFCTVAKELVTEGSLPMAVVDSATARILRLKFDLGLFENPYPRNDRFKRIGSAEHQAMAAQAALQSIVLLENKKQTLPLTPYKNIVLAGPNANSKRAFSGGWTIEWSDAPESRFPANHPTMLSALKQQLTGKTITHVDTVTGLAAAAKSADAIILALGETTAYAEGRGDINDLTLPTDQLALIDAALATGKPVIVVMLSGRPRVFPAQIDSVHAFVYAGLPSFHGPKALAQLLAGEANFRGRLPISYPSHAGPALPYNAKVHDRRPHKYPFGTGLSYTNFSYSAITLSDTSINQNQSIKASITVTNTGKRSGIETVQWYIKDNVRSITPLHRSLAHWQRVELKPGESKTLDFTIKPHQHLAFPNKYGKQ